MASKTFVRNRTNNESEPNTNYNYHDDRQLSNFKQPMPPLLTNGAKRVPGLMSATASHRSFNKPQQTVNPHFSRFGVPSEFGGVSELSNFKNLPELYPIHNVNRSNASYSTSSNLVNGHENSALFSSTKYGTINQRPTLNHSTSRLFCNSTNTKLMGLKANSCLSNVSKDEV